MKVDIENGKYTYVSHDSGAELLRYGEPWQDVTGQKVWYCTAYELQEVRGERDALAAHVERWREWLARDPEDDDEGSWMDDGWEIHASSPETSLAKRDAEKQAEALRLAHEKLSERKEWVAAHHLLQVASEINDKLRRQAGGDA